MPGHQLYADPPIHQARRQQEVEEIQADDAEYPVPIHSSQCQFLPSNP
jgi:hypothetical protein